MACKTTVRSGTEPVPAALPTLVPVAQLAKLEPALGVGSIRDDLFRFRADMERAGCLVYRGRRILLHRQRYLDWLTSRSGSRCA
jgi:hypothetical protein